MRSSERGRNLLRPLLNAIESKLRLMNTHVSLPLRPRRLLKPAWLSKQSNLKSKPMSAIRLLSNET